LAFNDPTFKLKLKYIQMPDPEEENKLDLGKADDQTPSP